MLVQKDYKTQTIEWYQVGGHGRWFIPILGGHDAQSGTQN